MIFFGTFTVIISLFTKETFHPAIRRRVARKFGRPLCVSSTLATKLRFFVRIALFRPLQMLLSEPIVALICLYVACEFATLFSFFAALPLVFQGVYGFGIENSGLVFLSIVVGCILGALTVLICDILLYRPHAAEFPGGHILPEYRLFPAMIGSIGLPIGLFWFGWTSRANIYWVSPAVAIMIFAWGNLCVFVSTTQYIVDTYDGSTVASALSANSLARYGLAAAFPLFTIQSQYSTSIFWF